MNVGVLRIVFAMIITIAAVCDDMKRYKISNRIVAVGLIVATVINACDFVRGKPVAGYMLGGLATFLIMLVGYGVIAVGAGDVKLSGVLGMLLGMDMILRVLVLSLLYTGLFGTVWSLVGKSRQIKLSIGKVHTIHYSVALLFGQMCVVLMMYTEVWI